MTHKMTPEEKAKQLVDGFLPYYFSYGNNIMERQHQREDNAKKSASFSVDNLIEFLVDASDGEFTFIYEVEYWQSVKNEIDKL